MVECEICMEKFPIDCFKFFPCAHKICQFCYHNMKELKCPYCRFDLDPVSDEDNYDYNPEPPLEILVTNRNRRRNTKRNRRDRQRHLNNYNSQTSENTSERFLTNIDQIL